MFPRLEYLEWISGRPDVSLYDLGSSDLRGGRGHEPVVVPDPLEGLPDPPVGATLETQIAGEYGVEPQQVLVTAGATLANLIAAATALQWTPDDDASARDDDVKAERAPQVLVEKPAYEPLVQSPSALGADVARFRRGDDYALEIDRAANAMTDGTRLVAVTNRHNPSGVLADRDTLEALAGVVCDGGARLLVDEVYAPYVLEARDGPFGGPSAVDLETTVVTSSLTKFFGLGDLRVGWLVSDRPFVDRARSIAHHFSAVAGTSRALGRRAFHNLDQLEARSRSLLEENAALLSDFVESRDDVGGVVPERSTFAFLDPENADGDELAAAAWEAGVLVVPGRFFDDAGRVRVSLGCSPSEVASALDALGDVLDGFR